MNTAVNQIAGDRYHVRVQCVQTLHYARQKIALDRCPDVDVADLRNAKAFQFIIDSAIILLKIYRLTPSMSNGND